MADRLVVRGAREHNLKDVSLDLPRDAMIVFTGLSGSGKSTIANLLEKRLHADGRHTYILDGDNIRHGLNRDLGFTEDDRVENIRRVAEVSRLMVDAGLIALVSFISPFRAERRMARELLAEGEFVEVFQQESDKLTDARWLAQGTIYPDVIESAGAKKKAHTIKSHHNVGGLPASMKLKLLEPLRDLFKDEVRELGVALGLPREMVYRHPFPGPGLGVRILGEVRADYASLLQRADAIFIDELRATLATERDVAAGLAAEGEAGKSWYDLTSQAFAVFLPVRSVGVMGDGRTYEHVVALRAVQTQDFMTAHWAHLPHELLGRVSNRIINEVRGINRVVYDISGKPPATIEWE